VQLNQRIIILVISDVIRGETILTLRQLYSLTNYLLSLILSKVKIEVLAILVIVEEAI